MPIVEPHLYADTPLFRDMLYERNGRFPGTPEGEEGDEGPSSVHVPEPLPGPPSGAEGNRLLPVVQERVRPVVPVRPLDPETTQSIALADLNQD